MNINYKDIETQKTLSIVYESFIGCIWHCEADCIEFVDTDFE